MYHYDPKSRNAEEFINHEEILETLDYAEANKHNAELIDALIEKAKLRKGLSHREASVLLACDIKEKMKKFTALQNRLKRISTETVSSCLHRCTFPIIVSTAVPTALII